MARLLIVEEDGSTLEFMNFVGAGINQVEGAQPQITHFLEDTNLDAPAANMLLVGAAVALGELASIVASHMKEGTDDLPYEGGD